MLLFGILKALFFGISKANISNKYATFWLFKRQKCLMKLVLGNWHLNTRIWHFKRWHLMFMKLTPVSKRFQNLLVHKIYWENSFQNKMNCEAKTGLLQG